MPHYHIRWSGKKVLDWERFATHDEAEDRAKDLVRLGETYTIEEQDETCPRCRSAFRSNAVQVKGGDAVSPADVNPQVKYPWQQAVLDASTEMRSEHRMRKISEAQRAMSARLRELTPADVEEQAALRDVLENLRALLPKQRKPKTESDDKKEIA